MGVRRKSRTAYQPQGAHADPFCAGAEGGPPFRFIRGAVGDELLRRGAPVLNVYCVRSGRVKLSVADAGGDERAIGMRGPDSLLGLEALLGVPALFDAQVDVAGELGVLPPARFERWLAEHPEHTPSVIKHILAEQVTLASERQLVDGPAESRLARFLLERAINRSLAAWNDTPRQEIAGLLGMRPETLSRTIRELQRQGVVDADLKVVDMRALQRLARENSNHTS